MSEKAKWRLRLLWWLVLTAMFFGYMMLCAWEMGIKAAAEQWGSVIYYAIFGVTNSACAWWAWERATRTYKTKKASEKQS
jgi:hypothetical protein